MNKTRWAYWFWVIFLLPVLASAQKIDSMMSVYAESFPQEKIHVHFDKNVYIPGETIWFKSYLFTGTDLSPISKNFYAEFSDGNGNLIQKKIAPLYESTASGNFEIPYDFKGNRIHFRAYTAWMLNFDTTLLFEKDIPILGGRDSAAALQAPSEPIFQIFPEGGEMITGVENSIAFKATDAYGLPIRVEGVVKDASGKNILDFSSTHDGMGKFMISPDKGDTFYALWKDEKGKERRTDFPAVKESGVALRVMGGNKKAYFSVARSADDSHQFDKVTIIAHMNQQLVYKAIVNLKDNFMSGGAIPTDQLPAGVLQITLFSTNNLPLAERVIFIKNQNFDFASQVHVLSKNLGKRAKNEIEIDVPDTVSSNLSISITDADADGDKPYQDNIVSRLLLTGELHGYVHNPAYYFTNASDSLAQQLDLVMLTHGWRKFKWEQLARGKTPVIKYPVENYLSIRADVFGVDPGRIASDEAVNVILQRKDSSSQMYGVPRTKGGRFEVSGLRFYDTAKAYYQFNVNRKLASEYAVVFSNGLLPVVKKTKPSPLLNSGWSGMDSMIVRRNKFIAEEFAKIRPFDDNKVKTLAAVTVTGRQKTALQKLDEQYASGLFSGGDSYNFDLANDLVAAAYPDIFTYLQGKVAGLMITVNGPNVGMQWRGSPVSVFLNEMPVDVQQLKTQSVSDIAYVKVFRPGSGLGFGGGANGSIAVYTKKGQKRDDATFKGLDKGIVIGYSVVREFYSPDYSQINDLNTTEDVRSTLYWKPYVLLDKNTPKTTIQFYNNDISRRLRIVLEGVNSDGKLTRVEKIVQ
ncbi:MAG: hypothetical protein C5B59_12560 [Bacteroidetes bacterium]|nr:MAG: hypothetical protein C5B59_12560 [Bacteroidota bacterium]